MNFTSSFAPLVVGPTTGGTSEGFRFQKLAEKSEETEDALDGEVNSFSNPNYENPEVGTKTEPAVAPAPTLFGTLVSVEEVMETEDSQGSDGKVDRSEEVKAADGEGVNNLFCLFTEGSVHAPFSGFQGGRI